MLQLKKQYAEKLSIFGLSGFVTTEVATFFRLEVDPVGETYEEGLSARVADPRRGGARHTNQDHGRIPNHWAMASRPRAQRDLTVPSATPRIWAVSATDSPCMSTSTSAAR